MAGNCSARHQFHRPAPTPALLTQKLPLKVMPPSESKLVPLILAALLLAAPAWAGQKDTTPPTQPANPTALPASCSQINLSWDASLDEAINGQAASGIQGYYLYFQGNATALKFVTSPNATATGLAGNTRYTFQIAAVDNSNNVSILSVPVSATTLPCSDTLAPSIPTGVTVSALDCTQVSLSWQASSDPTNPNQLVSGVSRYNLYRGGSFLKSVTGTGTSDANLLGTTFYAYEVSAVDAAGNESARSTSASITLPPCPPDPPTGLFGTAPNCQRVELSWSAPINAGSGFAAYKVYRDGNFIEQVSNPSFSESAPAPASSYSYWITTLDTWGRESSLSSRSASQCRVVPPPQPPICESIVRAPSSRFNGTAPQGPSTRPNVRWGSSARGFRLMLQPQHWR